MVYLPASASIYSKYVPALAPTPAPAPAPIYIHTTITKPKPVTRSLSSDTVVKRVELGLPQESELREWREETKSKVNPSTSKKATASTATRSREDIRSQDERSSDRPKEDCHRSRSQSPRNYVPQKRTAAWSDSQEEVPPLKPTLLSKLCFSASEGNRIRSEPLDLSV